MIKEILVGVAACALMASPCAFAQSSSDDQETAGPGTGAAHGQAYHGGHGVLTEPINLGQTLVASASEPVEVPMPDAALDRLVGSYSAQDKSVVLVTRSGNGLAADFAGLTLEFAPSGPNEFYVAGGPLTLSFTSSDAARAQGLVVRENGIAIIQATATR